ncbi:hypothetical protein HZH66_002073 [Vespula vulgaris]|uniref:Gustatory receptor n=1 Tax=Vespula vulgaris TaxID=7454 RepID=A0A834KNX9_VESVU|nr:hypothetical protein HZH66_002073 [Vespula vulgaris]
MKFGQLNVVLQSMLTTTIDSPQHKRILRMKDNWKDVSSLSTIYRTYKVNENLKKLKRVRTLSLYHIISSRHYFRILDEASKSFDLSQKNTYQMLILKNANLKHKIAKYRRKQVLILCHISLHAANTGDILCELYEPSTSKEFRSAIYDFTLQHIQNPLIFKVCGFFDLDYTLIRSMIVTITTYFVIFIQVGDAPSQKVKSYIFKMFKSKEFQRSVMPLIIANSIVCTVYYSFLFFAVKDIINTFMNLQATDMLGIITKFSFIQNSFLYGLIIFAGFTRKKWVKLFLEQLEVSTQRIDELNVSKNYSFLFWYQCIAGIILIFVISGYIITNIFWFSDCNLSIDYSLINFRQLNTVLQNMLTTTIGSPQHKRVLRIKDNWEDDSSLSTIYRTYKTNENLIKLKRIKQIYLELIKCARIINEAYGLQILLSMSSSLINITILLYSLYANILITNISKYILIFLILLYVANTGDILYELYEPSTSKKFRDEICDILYQLVQNRLKFTACGFYDIGHTFIYTTIGSITTYLIILIQIGGEPNTFNIYNMKNISLSTI